MKKSAFLVIVILFFATAMVYLVVQAPQPLPEVEAEKKVYSVEEAFRMIAKENDITRSIYTKEIVGKGKKSGLTFHEKWLDEDVEAGPLPALFLRGTATVMEKSPVPIGLYLGSDFPIAQSNAFSGIQSQKFEQIKKDHQPAFFFDEASNRYTAMFPDFASAPACVNCHNNHPDSPKKDWKLNDVMGATTWSYPADSLSTEEMLSLIKVFKKGVLETYKSYLEEVTSFKENEVPEIGDKWPSEGYFLPNEHVFMDSLNTVTSYHSLTSLLKKSSK